MEFDVKKYLRSMGIHFHRPGEKNVSSGWINISCPFCNDPSWHCGINLKSFMFNCWDCHRKGHLQFLVSKLSSCNFKKAKDIMEEFGSFVVDSGTTKTFSPKINRVDWPKGVEKVWPKLHLDFLESKNFNPKKIITEYNLKPCYLSGKYKYRIVIPIYENRKLVSFTTRDVTNKSDIKYKDLSPEQSIVPVKKSLYNLDKVDKNMVIVEGAGDVWRIGKGAVATFTTQFTDDQVYKIIEKDPDNVFIMYDGEEHATKQAYKLANKLSGFINKVEVIELEDGDPGELPDKDVKHLRKELRL